MSDTIPLSPRMLNLQQKVTRRYLEDLNRAADDALNFADIPTNGILAKSSDDTIETRTITGTALQVLVANGTGISGNPTLSLPQDIATSSSPSFVTQTLTGLTASQAVVTNGSKVLTSLGYATANTPSTLVQRDASGNFNAGTITADLTGAATNVGTTASSTNASFYPLFVSSTSGNQACLLDSDLRYNPSTDTLTATNFVGSFSGTVTTATNLAGGAANQIPYQTGSSTTAFMSAATNGVLVTNGSNVPSIGGTLPSAVQDNITRLGTVTTGEVSLTDAIINATGAVTRDVRDYFKDHVHVKDFGAVGDGSTDDSAALQAAADALTSGGTVHFSNATYYIGSTLEVNNSVIFKGGSLGCYIKVKNSLTTGININDAYCGFENISIIPVSGVPSTVAITVNAFGAQSNPNFSFQHCQIQDFAVGIDFTAASGWLLSNSYFSGMTTAGVRIANSVNPDAGDWCITNCFFTSGSSLVGDAILFLSSGGGKIIGNKVIGFLHGIHLAPAAGISTGDLIIVGNSIENTGVDAILLENPSGATLFGNTQIVSNQFLTGTVTISGTCYDVCSITGNVFYNADGEGIAVSNVAGLSICGNMIMHGYNSSTNAIVLTSNTDVTVTCNSTTGYTNVVSNSGSTYNSMGTDLLFTTPLITTGLKDSNGNTIVGLGPQASAVNYLNFVNAPTTNNVLLQALGSDTNISIAYQAKGTGTHFYDGGTTIQGWSNAGSILSHSIANVSSNRTATWPDKSGVVPLRGFTTTATAAGTTTLTVASTEIQYFTGATTQTVVLPVTSTLTTGTVYKVGNQSSGNVTVQSSGANTLSVLTNLQILEAICLSTSGTGTASWSWSVTTLIG